MGTLFKYISDEVVAMVPVSECQCCQKTAQVFPAEVALNCDEWDDYADAAYELCAGCLRSTPLRMIRYREQESKIPGMIDAHSPKRALAPGLPLEMDRRMRLNKFLGICDEFRRTPYIPLFLQDDDWPSCCGDFVEFVGVPATYEESIRVGLELQLWDRGFRAYRDLYGDMTLQPEELQEVSLFRCHECKSSMFTWQST